MRAAASALSSDLLDRLPSYEGHLSRELDRSHARYARLQEARRVREKAVPGELVQQRVQEPQQWSRQGLA